MLCHSVLGIVIKATDVDLLQQILLSSWLVLRRVFYRNGWSHP